MSMGKMLGAILMPASIKKGEEDDGGDPMDIPAQDLISAVRKGDVEGVKSALRAAVSCCSDEDMEPDPRDKMEASEGE